MKKTALILILIAIVPCVLFYLLDAIGATENLKYVSTTLWRAGDPGLDNLVLLFACMICWSWTQGWVYLFGGAALPFIVAALLEKKKTA
jgi:phosphotransferase system  glucose/maltose/N-acetylglucosamine-specific IIC component